MNFVFKFFSRTRQETERELADERDQGTSFWAENSKFAYGFGVDAIGNGHIFQNIHQISNIMTFTPLGKVGIGIDDPLTDMPDDLNGDRHYLLYVKGGILTECCRVAVKGTGDWQDNVFNTDYKLMSIYDLDTFIRKNNHLPNIPSAKEVTKNGIDVVEIDALLLQKIEELTLYNIQLQKEIDELKTKIKNLK